MISGSSKLSFFYPVRIKPHQRSTKGQDTFVAQQLAQENLPLAFDHFPRNEMMYPVVGSLVTTSSFYGMFSQMKTCKDSWSLIRNLWRKKEQIQVSNILQSEQLQQIQYKISYHFFRELLPSILTIAQSAAILAFAFLHFARSASLMFVYQNALSGAFYLFPIAFALLSSMVVLGYGFRWCQLHHEEKALKKLLSTHSADSNDPFKESLQQKLKQYQRDKKIVAVALGLWGFACLESLALMLLYTFMASNIWLTIAVGVVGVGLFVGTLIVHSKMKNPPRVVANQPYFAEREHFTGAHNKQHRENWYLHIQKQKQIAQQIREFFRPYKNKTIKNRIWKGMMELSFRSLSLQNIYCQRAYFNALQDESSAEQRIQQQRKICGLSLDWCQQELHFYRSMAETSVVCAATTTRLKQLEEIQILLEQCLQRDEKVVFGLNPQQLTDWDNARIKLLQTLHSKSVDCKSQAFDGYFIGTFFNEARFIAEEEAILVFHANAQSSPTAAITA